MIKIPIKLERGYGFNSSLINKPCEILHVVDSNIKDHQMTCHQYSMHYHSIFLGFVMLKSKKIAAR
jgi:hypothetical protein